MSLNWNTAECPGNGVTAGWINDDIHAEGDDVPCHIHSNTNSLVWGAFCGVHLGSITTKNINEWIWRIEFLKLLDRPWMSDKSFPTLEVLDNHLGFWTNCDTKTRRQWLAFITKSLSSDVDRILKKMYTSQDHVHAVNA